MRSSRSRILWGSGVTAIHAYSSIGLMYVQYKYERADELRLFLSLVNIWSTLSDLLMMLLTWVDHWRLCWKMTPRCRCCRTVLSGESLRKIVGRCAGGRLSWLNVIVTVLSMFTRRCQSFNHLAADVTAL